MENFIAENKYVLAAAFVLYVYVILPKIDTTYINKYYIILFAAAVYVGNISWEVGLAMSFAIYMSMNKQDHDVGQESVQPVHQQELVNTPNEFHPLHSTTEMSMNPEKVYIKEPECDAFDTTKTIAEKIEGFGDVSAVRGSAKLFSIDEN